MDNYEFALINNKVFGKLMVKRKKRKREYYKLFYSKILGLKIAFLKYLGYRTENSALIALTIFIWFMGLSL